MTDSGLDVATEPRQRWRLAFARGPVAPDRTGRIAVDEWVACLVSSGLRVAFQATDRSRPRLAIAAPLPANAAGCRELLDVWLIERIPRWQLREAVESHAPEGHRWVDAEEVWLGGPPLPGQVVAAEWHAAVQPAAGGASDRQRVRAAVDGLLAARTIERTRMKGGTVKRYDLRPLLAGLAVVATGPQLEFHVQTRFDPERGAGRPEEVIAAVSDAAGLALEVTALTRMRLILVR